MEGSAAGGLPGAGSSGGSGWGSGAGEEAEGDEDENMVYYFLEESTGYMEPALRCLSLLHTLVAFLCIIGYNCLKVGHDHSLGAGTCVCVCVCVCAVERGEHELGPWLRGSGTGAGVWCTALGQRGPRAGVRPGAEYRIGLFSKCDIQTGN